MCIIRLVRADLSYKMTTVNEQIKISVIKNYNI